MAQNNTNNGGDFGGTVTSGVGTASTGATPGLNTGATGTAHATGAAGSAGLESGGFAGGSATADTMRPTGGTASTQPGMQAETRGFEEARGSYQPTGTQVTVTQRRAASKPSRNMVIGSALVGAVAGGAIPFMLSGRKTAKTSTATVHQDRSAPSQSRTGRVHHQDQGKATTGVHQDRGTAAAHTDTGPVTDASTTRRP